MSPQREHPIISVLTKGICLELHEVRNQGLIRAALILLYSGMDQVSYLAMKPGTKDSSRKVFADWVEKYVVLQGATVVTGMELYAARCAMLHKYGTEAKLHVDGEVTRQIAICAGGPKTVYFDPVNPALICIEVNYLIDAFLDGVMQFTRDLEGSDQAYRNLVNERLHQMMDVFTRTEP
ncbi:hypothetical protein AEP_03901 [Curvibacter sp. AEP1-3]|nr:hypothetical protein AEP_03901 [Curvibacter sp. AEP1-3]